MIRHHDRRRFVSPYGAGAILLAVVSASLAVSPLSEWWTLARLRDRGETAEATITSSSTDLSGRSAVDVVHFEFQPASDHPRFSGVDRSSIRDLSGADPSEISRRFSHGELTVRYLPEDPSVNRLDVALPLRLGRAQRNGLLFLALALGFGIAGCALLTRGFFAS